MITVENTIYLSFGGVLGYLLKIIVEHSLTKSRNKEDRESVQFTAAANIFRSIVINELAGLYPEATDFPRDIKMRLSRSLPNIQAAVTVFGVHLKGSNTLAFQDAWKKFRNVCKSEIPKQCEPAEILYNNASPIKAQSILREHVDALLKFAA
ncbi:MAG: hypothetical protein ABL902_04115 [Gallionella sp.]